VQRYLKPTTRINLKRLILAINGKWHQDDVSRSAYDTTMTFLAIHFQHVDN